MFGLFKNSRISKDGEELQRYARNGMVRQEPPAIEGIQHRVSILRVKEGRIVEQSARLSGC